MPVRVFGPAAFIPAFRPAVYRKLRPVGVFFERISRKIKMNMGIPLRHNRPLVTKI